MSTFRFGSRDENVANYNENQAKVFSELEATCDGLLANWLDAAPNGTALAGMELMVTVVKALTDCTTRTDVTDLQASIEFAITLADNPELRRAVVALSEYSPRDQYMIAERLANGGTMSSSLGLPAGNSQSQAPQNPPPTVIMADPPTAPQPSPTPPPAAPSAPTPPPAPVATPAPPAPAPAPQSAPTPTPPPAPNPGATRRANPAPTPATTSTPPQSHKAAPVRKLRNVLLGTTNTPTNN